MLSSHSSTVVVGLQYGDEGKARVVDDLCRHFNVVTRFNGGANAGHTVEANGVKVALKQVPSGIFYPEKILYVGSGCVVNLKKLHDEILSLQEIGIKLEGRFHISCQAGLIQPHHVALDSLIGGKVGTTKNGIGPAYADRALRMWNSRLLNIRMGDLIADEDGVFKVIRENYAAVADKNDFSGFDIEAAILEMKQGLELIRPFIQMNPLFLKHTADKGNTVIFEGAQSFMLDVNKGDVPYVTSSSTAAPAAYLGGDLPPSYHEKTVGVAKVIMSRVGHGPFVSEFGGAQSEEYCMSFNDEGGPLYGKNEEAAYDIESLLASEDPFEMSKAIRSLSGEYGTVTTRPRRVGALDLVQLRYAIEVNGVDELVLTKCDLLNIYSRTAKGKIPIVKEYELEGERFSDHIPGSTAKQRLAKPIYSYVDAFSEDISNLRNYSDLPSQLKDFVSEVEEFTKCKVLGLGVGPGREQYILKN